MPTPREIARSDALRDTVDFLVSRVLHSDERLDPIRWDDLPEDLRTAAVIAGLTTVIRRLLAAWEDAHPSRAPTADTIRRNLAAILERDRARDARRP
jgi:hypothetical protein